MLQVGLIFHSARNDNLGVGALTVSEIGILRRIAADRGIPVHITVIDGRDPRPPCVEGPDITVREMRPVRRPQDVYRAVRGFDLVIDIGGGDSFADIYGWKRFARMHLQKYLVHLAGRPLVLAPQTIGPFRSAVFRRIAAGSIRRSAIVATRDAASVQAIRDMGLKVPVLQASDVALRLPFTPAPPRGAGPVRVGLNVSGLLANGGYTRANMFGLKADYRRTMQGLIAAFLAHPDGCEVHLVGHVIGSVRGGVEDDYQACLDLAAEFPGVRVAPAFDTPSEAKSHIATLDFFAGARMHACIAAFSSGVPVVPMAYSRKFAGLFGSLGYDRTVDCTTEEGPAMIARIMAAYDDRAQLAAEARPALALGLERLAAYETALGDLMARLAADRRA